MPTFRAFDFRDSLSDVQAAISASNPALSRAHMSISGFVRASIFVVTVIFRLTLRWTILYHRDFHPHEACDPVSPSSDPMIVA